MPTPSPLPAELGDEPFAIRTARAAGVPAERMRRSDLSAPFRGIRSTRPLEGHLDLCRAYAPRMREGEFFSHLSAAIVYGLPLPRRLEDGAELHVSGRTSRPRTSGVTGHRSASTPVRLVDGLVVTDPNWLLAELAALLEPDDLIVAGDALVRRKLPPTSLAELRMALETQHGRGVRPARVALSQVRSGTDSPMETRLRLLIIRADLPEPVIGHVIRNVAGDYLGRPDLAWVGERIAIEYEGGAHGTDRRVFADDIIRREQMEDAGWQVIRVISQHIYRSPHTLVTRLRAALTERRHLASSGQ